MLTAEQVKTEVAERGSKIATVVFIKANGDERTVNGLFKPTSHMECGDAPRKLAPGQIPIWSIAERKWKSFKADRVVEIR
jgi:hypothetical protein